MEQTPAPQFIELATEVLEQGSATLDGFRLILDKLRAHGIEPDMEQMGAVLDRLESVGDVMREMIDQEREAEP